MRDQDKLYLRAATEIGSEPQKLTVVSSEPLDQHLLEQVAANLGEITLYTQGFDLKNEQRAAGPLLRIRLLHRCPGRSDNQNIPIRTRSRGTSAYDGQQDFVQLSPRVPYPRRATASIM